MKKYSKLITMICTLLIICSSIIAQNKNYTPAEGFWVLESNVHNKKNTIIRFYTDQSVLIYEEKLTNYRMNIKRKKNLLNLKTGLEKALIAWNNKKEVIKNSNWMTSMIKEKK